MDIEEESRPPRSQDCEDQQECVEESWKPEQICTHLNSTKNHDIQPVGKKNLLGILINLS